MHLPQLLRIHWPAVVVALAIGFLTVLPPLALKFRHGIAFSSPVQIRIDDEWLYFARIRDVLDGHPTIGNPVLWEHKAKPPSPVFLGEYLVAQPLAWLGINPVAGGVLYDFLLPPVAALLAYAGLFAATRRRWLSLLGTAFLFQGWEPGTFARAVSPQFNFLFWLSLYLLSWRMVVHPPASRGGRLALVFLAAINLGLLPFLYTYYWTFWLVAFGIIALLLAVAGYRREAAAAGGTLGLGLLTAVPYLWFMRSAFALPEYAETLRRIGMIDTRFPSGIAIVIPAAALFSLIVLCLWRRYIALDRRAIFFLSGIVAAVASVNQHLLTGKNLEFSSHYLPLSVFWFTFTAAWLVTELRDRVGHFVTIRLGAESGRRALTVLAFGIALVPLALVGRHLSDIPGWFRPPPAEQLAVERYLPVLEWLETHAVQDEVVYASGELSSLIPIYTPLNVYFSNLARFSFVPDAEVLDRFILNRFFEDLDSSLIRQESRAIFGVYYVDVAGHAAQGNKLRGLFGLALRPADPLPGAAVERVIERARELRAVDFMALLGRYRVDYAVWERNHPAAAALDRIDGFETIADIGEFRVYRVR